jgi:hypothetical protein
VVIGYAAACLGSSSRSLALIAGALGRFETAVQHFEQALAMNERMGARPFVARGCVEYGELLLSGARDDHARGLALLQRGLDEAERLSLPVVRDRARRLLRARARAGAVR